MPNNEPIWRYAIRKTIDWIYRRRSTALIFFRGGLVLAALGAAGWQLEVNVPTEGGSYSLSYNNGGGPEVISIILVVFGLGVVAISGIVEIRTQRAESARLARKRVIVIEQRGLRDTSDTPLSDAIPDDIEGIRDQLLVDLRQRVQDGHIMSPEAALERLLTLPNELRHKWDRRDPADVTVVYGGLVPVPFAFLTGMLVDDENRLRVFDWDRHQERWRSLDAEDDGDRYAITGLDELSESSSEVIIAVSTSYRVDLAAVRTTLNDLPLVHLELPNGSTDCHWSEAKQRALAKIFHDTVVTLNNRGATRFHLFIAAPNSVVFNLGRRYDKRNLPPAVVYQYERSETPPYPWGVSMPVHGVQTPRIFRP